MKHNCRSKGLTKARKDVKIAFFNKQKDENERYTVLKKNVE